MNTFKVKVGELNNSNYNPRIIDTYKYEALKKSLLELPDMLEIRPIIIDEQNNIIAGNMRYRACIELGYKEVYVKQFKDFTDEEKKELMIKDNISYGEWDEQILSHNFNTNWVNDWLGKQTIDYSVLFDNDVNEKLDDMQSNVKKAFHIKINGDFNKAKELEKHFKDKKIYIGGLLIEKLKEVNKAYEKN
jgi:ParB-like chromosome segregation protein Spo0J